MKPLNNAHHTLVRPLLILLLLVVAIPATAEVHRISDTQTGWYYYYNVTAAELTDAINETGSRIIDLEVVSTSPLRFTASLVRNQGEYASGWWWYYGMTYNDVVNAINELGGRLIDIEAYQVGGEMRYAILLVPNTGDQQKSWWWLVNASVQDIVDLSSRQNARLVDIESYTNPQGQQVFATIMIHNTGEDYAPWGWFHNTPAADVTSWMNENNMRILEFEVRDSSSLRMDAILISRDYHTPATWWWYYNLTASGVEAVRQQTGSRIVDIDQYQSGSGGTLFNIVMLNNSNDLTVEIADILDWGNDGSTGLYLKEVDGPTLAALQSGVQFEPASTIKAIHNYHAIRQVQLGNSFMNSLVFYTTQYDGSCPIGPNNTPGSLQSVLTAMMVNSDNAATRAIADYYGASNIEDTARNIAGMTDTELNHTLGCGADAVANPNRLTLEDAGALYEGIETLSLLNFTHRNLFYSVMQNQDTTAPWWFTNDLFDLVEDEAADLGYPSADSFKEHMRFAWKPGGYTFTYPANVFHEYVSVAGVVTLPLCHEGDVSRSYVFGVFCDDASLPPFNKVREAATELFRDLVREHLIGCPSAVPETQIAGAVRLEPNVPNPFNPRTDIYFSLEQDTDVVLTVHDISGREVTRFSSQLYPAGRHSVTWNGRDNAGRSVASGTYFARIEGGGAVQTRKMVLLR